MNNKRQTIWLVSMLSLMVILSAYYLFSEDVPSADKANNQIGAQLPDAAKTSGTVDGVEIVQVDTLTGKETNQTASEQTGLSPEDQEVLKSLTNLQGMEMMAKIQLERRENVDRLYTELTSIITDSKNYSAEDAVDASQKLNKLEEMDNKIASLEVKLLQDFDNAVVAEEASSYNIIVLSDKLEKKQAVDIIELAMNELSVTPDRITVQAVK